MIKKSSFILHLDSLSVLNDLSDGQIAELMRAFIAYHENEVIDLSPITKLVFHSFKNQFDRDLIKYKTRCERNRVNGIKGGRRKNPLAPSGPHRPPLAPIGPHSPPIGADSDSDSDSDSDKEKIKRKTFKPPTVEMVRQYITEKNYTVDAESFINHYESNGWQVGRTKMKNWKAAVRTWQTRNQDANHISGSNRKLTAVERVTLACKKREDEVNNRSNDIPTLDSYGKNLRP